MTENLEKKTIKGISWNALERVSGQLIQFIVMIIMARILTPKDYGLVGMLAIFIAISQSLVDSGFSQALIRKKDRNEKDTSTIFIFNTIVAGVLYLLLYIFSPAISKFYHEPNLIILTRVLCIVVIINALGVVQRALFSIRIDFKTQSKATIIGALSSGVVGISMAYTGFGVWSIVAQQITNASISTILIWFWSHWRPTFCFSGKAFKEMFSFGSKLTISGILDTLYKNSFLIVIGKFFNAADLGFYTRAQQFAEFPSSNATGILQKVTFPVLCTIEDDTHLRNAYNKLLRLSSFIVFPVMMILAGASKPFVMIILNSQWEFTGTLLQILCFAMMWYPTHAINLNLLQVKGRSDIFLKLDIIKKTIGTIIIIITFPWGIEAMCYGSVVASVISLAINTFYTKRIINLGFIQQLKELFPSIIYSLTTFFVVLLTQSLFNEIWESFLFGVLSGIIYFVIIIIITKSKELNEIKGLLKNIKTK